MVFEWGLIIKNFQGKNRTFRIEASIGGKKENNFLINDPWIFGNHISLSTFLEINSYEHLFLIALLIDVKKY